MAALQAARQGANVTLLERNDTVGRKLTVTGSGHCNLTNDAVATQAYTCADPKWMAALLSTCGVKEVLGMLESFGIPARKTEDGWYYPLSNSAHSVVEAFSSAINRAGINLLTGCRVTGIQKNEQSFTVRYTQGEKEGMSDFDRVIVSAGGCAYPDLGSRGDLFRVLERMGHTTLPNRPALAPILVDKVSLKPLQGIRFDVAAVLWDGTKQVAGTRGNLIFTEWGLNGPAVMDISHQVTLFPAGTLDLSLDFLTFFQEEFNQLLSLNRHGDLPARVFLDAFFPPKASSVFLKIAGIPETMPISQITQSALDSLLKTLNHTRLKVKGVRGFEYCQVSAGGVPVTEVDPVTLESYRVKGLYLTGETLDVVGPCGGYNLHFAFSSGALAGKAATA